MIDIQEFADKLRMGVVPELSEGEAMDLGDALLALSDSDEYGRELASEVDGMVAQLDPEAQPMSSSGGLSVILARFDANASQLLAVRQTLIAFGALEAGDTETDTLALLKFLLPPL